jgi:hypothetical protein
MQRSNRQWKKQESAVSSRGCGYGGLPLTPLVDTTHGSQKALAENYRPPCWTRRYSVLLVYKRKSAERHGERSLNEGRLKNVCSVVALWS